MADHRQWCGEGLEWGQNQVEGAMGEIGDICNTLNIKIFKRVIFKCTLCTF